MIKIYRKTATIKAERFDGSAEMIDKYHVRYDTEYMLSDDPLEYSTVPYQMETLKGFLNINVGDWIATGVEGEHWPIAEDVFKKTYAELPVIPNYVAEYIDYMKSSYRDIWDAIHYPFRSNKVDKYMEDNSETFARAWLDGYVVEGNK